MQHLASALDTVQGIASKPRRIVAASLLRVLQSDTAAIAAAAIVKKSESVWWPKNHGPRAAASEGTLGRGSCRSKHGPVDVYQISSGCTSITTTLVRLANYLHRTRVGALSQGIALVTK